VRVNCAFELVDTGLRSMSPGTDPSAPSPGVAVVEGATVLVGIEAARAARLMPRRLHSRFWEVLGTAELERPFPAHLRTADLVHAHLQRVWNSAEDAIGGRIEEAILAVPGLYSEEQLGLLLGIAAACGIPVGGLVDLAVAAAVGAPSRPRSLHLDLHLHRAVLTELDFGSEVARRKIEVEPRVGFQALLDGWARGLADLFIRTTRFDPLHHAATEQVLYDRLPGILEELAARQSTRVVMTAGGREYEVELERSRILAAARSAYDLLAAWVGNRSGPDPTTLLVSDRAAALPGLISRLEETPDLDVVSLPPGAAAGGALAHADRICSSRKALRLTTNLPLHDADSPTPVTVTMTPPPRRPRGLPPTHLVIDGTAHRITPAPFFLGTSRNRCTVQRVGDDVVVEDSSADGALLNDRRIEGTAVLAAGDRLLLSSTGVEALLTRMAEPDD